jgi:hypothetical protein
LAEGLSSIESFNPVQPLQHQREIHSLIDQYLRDAQNRNKKPLRAETAKVRRYILNKFVKHCGIIQVGDITLPKIEVWLAGLKAEGKAKDTCWGNGQRVRSFVKYLVSKGYLAEKILTDFTVPEQSAVGRKNWIRKVEVTKVLDAADRDPVLKFALLCPGGNFRSPGGLVRSGNQDARDRLLLHPLHQSPTKCQTRLGDPVSLQQTEVQSL